MSDGLPTFPAGWLTGRHTRPKPPKDIDLIEEATRDRHEEPAQRINDSLARFLAEKERR